MTRPSTERFERLVRDLHAPVFRSARRMCADDSAAADVVQEVFASVWTGKVSLDRAENERAMLCWLAARLAANAKRAATRRSKHEEARMQCHAPAPTRDPFDTTTDDELRRMTSTCVDELPADLRVPLLMRHQDDLTLAAIGAALALPTSTVHDRIEQALERLRARLVRRDPALAIATLPRLVAELGAPPMPSGLEARLLALPKVVPVAATATKALTLAAAAGVLAVGFALAANRSDRDPDPTTSARVAAAMFVDAPQDPPSSPPVAGERQPVVDPTPRAQPAAQQPENTPAAVLATFTGTVRDAEAWPVVGATVQVVTGGGLKPIALGAPATTDARGAFTVTASRSWLDPKAVRVLVLEKDRELLATGDLVVPRAADAAPLELVLPASAGTATSRFELAIDVRDEAGLVLGGVEARLYAAVEPAPCPDWSRSEGNATAAANGQAVLAGRGLGPKWLFVDGRPLHRESSFTKVAITKPGPVPLQVVLGKGGELTVVVKSVSGREFEFGTPWVIDERSGLRFDGEADGAGFRFRGLANGPHSVMARGDGNCSLAARHGVLPGGRVELTLKDQSDEHDVGDHLAELHGELVDAASGEVIEFGPFAIDTMPVLADGSSLASDGIEPPAPAQRAAPSGRFRRFHETGLAPGRHAIVVDVPGYAIATAVFELQANEVRTGIRIVLQKQAVVRGRVVAANGEPVKGASLFAIGTGPLADRLLEAWRAHRDRDEKPGDREVSFTPVRGWSQDDGAFTVGRVPAGVPLRLVARHDDHGLVVVPLPALEPGREIADFAIRFGR